MLSIFDDEAETTGQSEPAACPPGASEPASDVAISGVGAPPPFYSPPADAPQPEPLPELVWPDSFIDKVICADAIRAMRSIPDESVSVIITDPPYGLSNLGALAGFKNGAPTEKNWKWDQFSDSAYDLFTHSYLREVARVLKPGRVAYIWCGDLYAGVLARIGKVYGLKPKCIIVARKLNPSPSWRKNNWKIVFETCVMFSNGPLRIKNFNFLGQGEMENFIEVRESPDPSLRFEQSIEMGFPMGRKVTKHDCEKPEAVILPLIESASDPGDVVLDMFAGCYDANTEVLTDRGFVPWPNVRDDDLFMTRSPTGVASLRKAVRVTREPYVGEMHRYKNRSTDLLVTPNHSMLVRDHHSTEYELIPSSCLKYKIYHIPNSSLWIGESASDYPLSCSAEAWFRFLGLFLAEGCSSRGLTEITQSKSIESIIAVRELVRAAVGEEFREYTENKGKRFRFIIKNDRLNGYLSLLGKQPDRFVPRSAMAATTELLLALLDGLLLGDGHRSSGGREMYFTCSERLANDVAELFIKTGRAATVLSRMPKEGAKIHGRELKSFRLQYQVQARFAKETEINTHKRKFVEQYNGIVYCATVPPDHTLLVKRNGMITWCGNSGVVPTTAKKYGRRYIAVEREPEFVKWIERRLAQQVLFSPAVMQEGLPFDKLALDYENEGDPSSDKEERQEPRDEGPEEIHDAVEVPFSGPDPDKEELPERNTNPFD